MRFDDELRTKSKEQIILELKYLHLKKEILYKEVREKKYKLAIVKYQIMIRESHLKSNYV